MGYLWELVEEMEEPSVYKDDRRWMRNVRRLHTALDSGVDSGQISRKTLDRILRHLFWQRSPRPNGRFSGTAIAKINKAWKILRTVTA